MPRRGGFDPRAVKLPLNRWIMAEADKALAEIEAGIEGYKFNEAALAAYRFTWNIVCDWYLELAKPVLQGEDGLQRTRPAPPWPSCWIARWRCSTPSCPSSRRS